MYVFSGYEVVSYPITDQLSEEEVVAEDDKGDKSAKDDDGGKSVRPLCKVWVEAIGVMQFQNQNQNIYHPSTSLQGNFSYIAQ